MPWWGILYLFELVGVLSSTPIPLSLGNTLSNLRASGQILGVTQFWVIGYRQIRRVRRPTSWVGFLSLKNNLIKLSSLLSLKVMVYMDEEVRTSTLFGSGGKLFQIETRCSTFHACQQLGWYDNNCRLLVASTHSISCVVVVYSHVPTVLINVPFCEKMIDLNHYGMIWLHAVGQDSIQALYKIALPNPWPSPPCVWYEGKALNNPGEYTLLNLLPRQSRLFVSEGACPKSYPSWLRRVSSYYKRRRS